jgi:hypothetical protein
MIRSALLLFALSASTLDAPAQVPAGAVFEVRWTGPDNALDYVGIGGGEGQSGKSQPVTIRSKETATVRL